MQFIKEYYSNLEEAKNIIIDILENEEVVITPSFNHYWENRKVIEIICQANYLSMSDFLWQIANLYSTITSPVELIKRESNTVNMINESNPVIKRIIALTNYKLQYVSVGESVIVFEFKEIK